MDSTVESIERATLAALAPSPLEEIEGWLIPLDRGTVGRAKSAVPMHHGKPDGPEETIIDLIEGRYSAHGLTPMFRLPDVATFDSVRSVLIQRKYNPGKPTLVQTGRTSFVDPYPGFVPAEVQSFADDEWASVFLGEGFDPVDGASRVETLRRAQGSLFAQIRNERGGSVAAGALALSHGWASIHGMRTTTSHRRRGLARRVLTTLAQEAAGRGYTRMVLQVEASNTGALQLYAGCGFQTAWSYSYWTQAVR